MVSTPTVERHDRTGRPCSGQRNGSRPSTGESGGARWPTPSYTRWSARTDGKGARTGLLGPFSVSPRQIMDLGSNFATFVNELLRMELASAGLGGGHLTTTYQENLSDEGIDTGLRQATATQYLPAGDSAWQFKAGNLDPAECRTELRKAKAALDVIRSGGVYRLVLGADLTAAKVRRRRIALEAEAAELGVDVGPDTFVVLNASDLAHWASGYPALALSPLIGGIGDAALPFRAWSAFRGMTGAWVDSPSRQNLATEVRRTIIEPAAASLHVEAVSGVGKTRAVLEAIRGQDFEALVVYMPSADQLAPSVLQSLHAHDRQAVVIVDECGARQHELLSEQLPAASTIKLITIGEPSGYRPSVRPYRLEGLEHDALWRMIRAYRPALPREHCQVVADTAGGNAKLARLLANDIVGQPRSTAVELLTEDVIGSFVTRALPGGPTFLACSVLALLPAIGFDEDPGTELASLATAFDMTVNDLRAAAADLDRANLISRQGRYRAVAPYPLALYLAARAWRDLHHGIEQRLLQALDVTTTERLFRRAADCGVMDTARTVVERLLAPTGLYARLDVWGRGAESMLLVHFAVLAPRATCDYVEALLAQMADEQLADVPSRTVLTWAIERLAWHTTTFHRAADLLLRLAVTALADHHHLHEDLGRNSAVRSWTDLFGVELPTTAALPTVRSRYLRTTATSADEHRRILSVEAAHRVLTIDEISSTSPSAQGAVLVEPRGVPVDAEEAIRYVCGAIDVLAKLARDPNTDVAGRATKHLVGAIHPYVARARQEIRDHLATTIAALPEPGLTSARTALARLEALFERTSNQDREQATVRRQRLAEFRSHMPTATAEQELDALAGARRWDFRDGSLPSRLTDAARALPDHGVPRLLMILRRRPEAMFEIGLALGDLATDDDRVRDHLVADAHADPAALAGYLTARVRAGSDQAFDELLDLPGLNMAELTQLRVSTEGPPAPRAWTRVSALLPNLSPTQGADALARWHDHLTTARLREYVADWRPRIRTPDEYAAVLDLVALVAMSQPDQITDMGEEIADLVARRRDHPRVPDRGQWAWEQLARQQLTCRPVAVVTVLMDLLEAEAYPEYQAGGDDSLVRDAVVAAGSEGWRTMMERRLQGTHQVRSAAGRWLGNVTGVDTIRDWVGENVERARVVAAHTGPDAGGLSPTARFLITEFGTDEGVTQLLRSRLIPISYSGTDAGLYQRILDQITDIDDFPPDPVAEWVEETVEWLRDLLIAARQATEP